MKYDVAIIGSGLGGLQSAYILGKEGYNVCLIEKNKALGGCLQTFTRCGSKFDTGMHYIGGLDEGQVLYKFFKYYDLIGRLKLKRLDEDGYDIIRYKAKEYKFAMGYERFTETMLQQFPHEKKALKKYVEKLKEVNSSVDIYNMRDFSPINNTRYFNFYSLSIDKYLDTIISDKTLKNVLVGLSPLYAGVKDKSPLYIPMMIHSSYIEGAYRFVDGGSQLTDFLADSLIHFGGTILKNAEVTHLVCKNNRISSLEINNTQCIEADKVISDIHPKSLLKIIDEHAFRVAYRNRIYSTEETNGMFSLYLSMKDKAFRYINHNYYNYHMSDLWKGNQYTEESWPGGYMIHFSPVSASEEYTNAIIVNTYMNWEEMIPWINTRAENRGENYKIFKQKKAEKLLALLEKDFPGINKAINCWFSSTPLTYRDYTGTWEGSVYGMLKDYNNPMKTLIMPRTHISNLLLTGQNTNIHGVVGVTISSFLTCSELLGKQYLIDKIRDAC
jgi:all-trans-retinol 13,14-reductase